MSRIHQIAWCLIALPVIGALVVWLALDTKETLRKYRLRSANAGTKTLLIYMQGDKFFVEATGCSTVEAPKSAAQEYQFSFGIDGCPIGINPQPKRTIIWREFEWCKTGQEVCWIPPDSERKP